MLSKAVRALLWVAYGVATVVVFATAGYISFSLFVRSGVTTVPELVGHQEAEVEGVLAQSGLRVRRPEEAERYDDQIASGAVLRQSPGAGSLVKRGSAVEIIVSLGPQLVEVPDLRGSALQAAQVTLAAAGLTVGRTEAVYSLGLPSGTVVEQAPLSGARVGRAQAVDLYLSQEDRAETYVMPDLVYRDLAVVRHFFDRLGFRLGSVKFEPYESVASGIVLRQFPLPGHPLRRRDVISLVVSSGVDEAGG